MKFIVFILMSALFLFSERIDAAELAVPLHKSRINKTMTKSHIPLAIGITLLPGEKSACTTLLKEMKLCR